MYVQVNMYECECVINSFLSLNVGSGGRCLYNYNPKSGSFSSIKVGVVDTAHCYFFSNTKSGSFSSINAGSGGCCLHSFSFHTTSSSPGQAEQQGGHSHR